MLSCSTALAQELYAEQSWELTTDQNNNGWVDDGDIITSSIKVSYNHLTDQTITVKNDFVDPHFVLVNGTVKSSKGTISSGNKKSDGAINIKDIHLGPSWDYATITFDAIANFDASQVAYINNKSLLISPSQTIESNDISIPLKSSYIASDDEAGLISSLMGLLSILAIGIIFGVVSDRLKVGKLNQATLE